MIDVIRHPTLTQTHAVQILNWERHVGKTSSSVGVNNRRRCLFSGENGLGTVT